MEKIPAGKSDLLHAWTILFPLNRSTLIPVTLPDRVSNEPPIFSLMTAFCPVILECILELESNS
jgi:hypothetical protein